MQGFVGRQQELSVLQGVLDRAHTAVAGRAPGQCLLLRGRRRIGKSSLVEEFLRRTGAPAVFFTAARQNADAELAALWEAVADSNLPQRHQVADLHPQDWPAALRALANLLPDDRPSVVVLDEVPYLMETVPAFEGILQRAWDRELSRKPVLLILIGSDLAMMEALNQYDRPFHQRGREMVIGPLNPAEVAAMLDLTPSDAWDAALVTGGLPLICLEWPRGASVQEFLADALADPVSALIVSAERSLAAEFPAEAQAREVLAAIGSGVRTFSNIAKAAGGISHSSLSRALELLTTKRVVAAETPVSTISSRERRYRVTDPYLSFWLRFIRPDQPLIERRRPDLVLERIDVSWPAWRGFAVEPLIRESIARLLPVGEVPAASVVGSYWTRNGQVEVDIVGADRAPVARTICFVGSIKWRDGGGFGEHDLLALQRHRALLTDQPAPLIAASRTGVTCAGLDAAFGPADLLAAWPVP